MLTPLTSRIKKDQLQPLFNSGQIVFIKLKPDQHHWPAKILTYHIQPQKSKHKHSDEEDYDPREQSCKKKKQKKKKEVKQEEDEIVYKVRYIEWQSHAFVSESKITPYSVEIQEELKLIKEKKLKKALQTANREMQKWQKQQVINQMKQIQMQREAKSQRIDEKVKIEEKQKQLQLQRGFDSKKRRGDADKVKNKTNRDYHDLDKDQPELSTSTISIQENWVTPQPNGKYLRSNNKPSKKHSHNNRLIVPEEKQDKKEQKLRKREEKQMKVLRLLEQRKNILNNTYQTNKSLPISHCNTKSNILKDKQTQPALFSSRIKICRRKSLRSEQQITQNESIVEEGGEENTKGRKSKVIKREQPNMNIGGQMQGKKYMKTGKITCTSNNSRDGTPCQLPEVKQQYIESPPLIQRSNPLQQGLMTTFDNPDSQQIKQEYLLDNILFKNKYQILGVFQDLLQFFIHKILWVEHNQSISINCQQNKKLNTLKKILSAQIFKLQELSESKCLHKMLNIIKIGELTKLVQRGNYNNKINDILQQKGSKTKEGLENGESNNNNTNTNKNIQYQQGTSVVEQFGMDKSDFNRRKLVKTYMLILWMLKKINYEHRGQSIPQNTNNHKNILSTNQQISSSRNGKTIGSVMQQLTQHNYEQQHIYDLKCPSNQQQEQTQAEYCGKESNNNPSQQISTHYHDNQQTSPQEERQKSRQDDRHKLNIIPANNTPLNGFISNLQIDYINRFSISHQS